MTTPLTVTDQEFDQAVLRSDKLVLVDFWATWCAACRLVAPIIDELASDYAGRVTVVKVNVDENPEYATQYVVQRTPTLLFIRNGREVDRIVGAGKKDVFTKKLDALLTS
jgi:thioredoxin 1